MYINDKRETHEVPISKLKVGTWFLYDTVLHILTDAYADSPAYTAINVCCGLSNAFCGNILVQPVDINIDIVENLKV